MAAQALGSPSSPVWSTPGAIRVHGPAPTTRAPRPQWLHRRGSSRGRAVEHAGHLGPSRRGDLLDRRPCCAVPAQQGRGGARLIVEVGASRRGAERAGERDGPTSPPRRRPVATWPQSRAQDLRGYHRSAVKAMLHSVQPARRRLGQHPIRPALGLRRRQAPRRVRPPRSGQGRPLGVHIIAHRGVDPDLVQQPQRAPQPRDPAAHRLRGHLPQPPSRHPPDGSRPGRTNRRTGRRPTLPQPGRPRQIPTRTPTLLQEDTTLTLTA